MKVHYLCFIILIGIVGLLYPRERIIQKGTTISGVCLLGTSWGATFIAGAMVASKEPPDERGGIMTVGIPIVGPIIFCAEYGNQVDDSPVIWAAYLGLSAAQGVGLGLFIRGMVGDKASRISLVPSVCHDAPGFSCRCTF